MREKTFSIGKSILEQGDYLETLSGVKNVRLIITSPPYNIGSAGKREDGMRRGEFVLLVSVELRVHFYFDFP